MTELMGVPPRWGFGPHSTAVTGGLHAQRSAGGDCSVSSGVLSPGVIRQGVGVWKRTFATVKCRGDRLAHTVLRTRSVLMCSKIVERFSNAFILGGLERGCFTATRRGSEGQRHRPRVSARCRDGLSGARLRVPLHRVRFGPDAVIQTTTPTNKSMSVANGGYGSPYPRHRRRRHLRPSQSRQRRAWRDVGGTASRPVGNPAGRRIAPSGTERPRLLPRLKPWGSALLNR